MHNLHGRIPILPLLPFGALLFTGCSPEPSGVPARQTQKTKVFCYEIKSDDTAFGELWLDTDNGRFVYRFYDPAHIGLAPANLRERTNQDRISIYMSTYKYRPLPAPPVEVCLLNKATPLFAAAGYDGSCYWIAGPKGFKTYPSLKALNAEVPDPHPFNNSLYDLALLHRLFRHLDNPSWSREHLQKAILKSECSKILESTPSRHGRDIRLPGKGPCYLINPPDIYRYYCKLDDEAASIRSCFMTQNYSAWSGLAPNPYYALNVRHYYLRRETDLRPPQRAYSIDTYLPKDAEVIEVGKPKQNSSSTK